MLLKNRPTSFLVIFLAIAGCNSAEVTRLQIQNDSLRSVLASHQAAAESLEDITMWLDSIDASRTLLLTDLAEGTSHEGFSSRLNHINEFVKISEEKIGILQKALNSSEVESSAYLMLVNALKSEVQLRVNELIRLNEQVRIFKDENEGLEVTIKRREDEVNEISRQASAKDQELLLLEAKIHAMENNLKATEADAYYARALAVEQAARRTKLAPGKKRETFKEALELYKKSWSLGKKEAKADIVRLEKKGG